MRKITIGVIEKVKIIGEKEKEILAKIDTGSYNSSIDISLASEIKLGPIVKSKKITSSHGSSIRALAEGIVIIRGKKLKALFHLADRGNLRFPVLIGRKTLKDNFLIDPSKK